MALYKDGDYPGAYSASAPKKAIMADLLKKFRFNNGKLPYEEVVNPAHRPETQKMMEYIIKLMAQEDLIAASSLESPVLLLGEKGKTVKQKENGDEDKKIATGNFFRNVRKILVIVLLVMVAAFIMVRILQKYNNYVPSDEDSSQNIENTN
jgi:hypothetical protein